MYRFPLGGAKRGQSDRPGYQVPTQKSLDLYTPGAPPCPRPCACTRLADVCLCLCVFVCVIEREWATVEHFLCGHALKTQTLTHKTLRSEKKAKHNVGGGYQRHAFGLLLVRLAGACRARQQIFHNSGSMTQPSRPPSTIATPTPALTPTHDAEQTNWNTETLRGSL